jgi:hypothetical protein
VWPGSTAGVRELRAGTGQRAATAALASCGGGADAAGGGAGIAVAGGISGVGTAAGADAGTGAGSGFGSSSETLLQAHSSNSGIRPVSPRPINRIALDDRILCSYYRGSCSRLRP